MPRHAACGAEWSGARACHCSGCCRTFSGLGLFDAHRRQYGDRGGCLDPAEIEGMELVDGVWRGPEMSDEAKAKAFGSR